ncbi:flagellar biosynthesis protein FliA [Modestobacter versicolor]|uniref:flagellar biosynthesis protein FliA n=1 Tax=Modestobacter versicolor TaxID=429133 RepID=UPI0034DE6B3E
MSENELAAQHVATTPTDAGPRSTAQAAEERRIREPLVFGGLPEAEGWALAPITPRDRVHFRTDRELPLGTFRQALPAGVTVTYDEGDGLYRVDGEPGSADALAALIRAWCATEGYTTVGLRPETGVRRRAPRDLPPAFLADLCRHYCRVSLKRLQRNMSTIRLHLPDNDDIDQQVAEWVLKAVSTYDETKSVPFGAYLATQLSKWVHDLGRNAYGRTAADTENKQQKAVAAFTAEHQRRPSEKELAAYMGQSVATLRRNSQTVATLNGLRNLQSLDGGADAVEFVLPDSSEVPDEIMGEAEQTLLSHALTAACAPDPTARRDQRAAQPNVLGWATWYLTTWGGQTKTQLSADLGTSVRNMNVHADRAERALKERLAELAG